MHGSMPAAQGEQGNGVHGAGSKRMLYMEQGEREWCTWSKGVVYMEQGEREWCTWNRERRDGVHGAG